MKIKNILLAIFLFTGFISSAQNNNTTININPIEDAMIHGLAGKTTINYGTLTTMRSQAWTSGGLVNNQRSLIKFSLDQVPNNAVIESATLHLKGAEHYPLNKVNDSRLYFVEENWSESSVNWENQPLISTNIWAPVSGTTYGQVSNENRDVDITEIVKKWQSGIDNNGLMLKLDNEVYYTRMYFHSNDAIIEDNRPVLEIEYSIPQHTMISWDNSNTSSTISINEHTITKLEEATGWNCHAISENKIYQNCQGYISFKVLNDLDNYNIGLSDDISNDFNQYAFGAGIRSSGEEGNILLKYLYINNTEVSLDIPVNISDNIKLSINKEISTYSFSLEINNVIVDLSSYEIDPSYSNNLDLHVKANLYNISCELTNIAFYTTGRTFYVNDNSLENDVWCTSIGNDENNGLTKESPVSSINTILVMYELSGNDTIFIESGEYTFTTSLNEVDQGDEMGNLNIIGMGSTLTLFTSTSEPTFSIINANKIHISNMNLSSIGVSNIILTGSNNIHLDRLHIENETHSNIIISNTPDDDANIELSRLFVFNKSQNYAVQFSNSSNITFQKSLIGAAKGIDVISSSDCNLYNNMFKGDVGIQVGATSSSFQAYFNSFDNTSHCISFLGSNSLNNWDVRNNIFVSNNSSCLYFPQGTDVGFKVLGYNMYWFESGSIATVESDTYSSLETWESSGISVVSGEFAENSLVSDPQYKQNPIGLLYTGSNSPTSTAGQAILKIISDFNDGPYDLNSTRPVGASQNLLPNNPTPYCHTSIKPDGETYHFSNETIRFVYKKEYSTVSTNEKLNYKIFNEKQEVVYETGSISTWDENIHQGVNYFDWQAPECGGLMEFGYNLLEITNVKNEKWFLKFKIDKQYSLITVDGKTKYFSPCTTSEQVHNLLFN